LGRALALDTPASAREGVRPTLPPNLEPLNPNHPTRPDPYTLQPRHHHRVHAIPILVAFRRLREAASLIHTARYVAIFGPYLSNFPLPYPWEPPNVPTVFQSSQQPPVPSGKGPSKQFCCKCYPVRWIPTAISTGSLGEKNTRHCYVAGVHVVALPVYFGRLPTQRT